MNTEKVNNNRKEVGEEIVFNIPNDGKVYNADWRDDIVQQASDEEPLDYETYDNETGYDSSMVKASAEADRKVELFSKTRLRGIGHRTLDLMKLA